MTDAQKPAKSTTAKNKTYEGFTDEERGAMKARAQELKTAARRGARAGKVDGETAVLAKIAEMLEPDRVRGERLHAVITASAPDLSPRLWYGMPAYAKDGKIVCFFQPAQKFKTRYATLGFNDAANLDEGTMWPTYYALTELTAADEARIGALVKKAVSLGARTGESPSMGEAWPGMSLVTQVYEWCVATGPGDSPRGSAASTKSSSPRLIRCRARSSNRWIRP